MFTHKKILSVIAATAMVMALAQPVSAQYGQYGGNPSSPADSIFVDKTVAQKGSVTGSNGVQAGIYRDNLSTTDSRFFPTDRVYFKIVTKNTSDHTLNNITVRDQIPTYLTPLVGPGSFDQSSRVITWTIPELKSQEQRIDYFTMQVVELKNFPANQSIILQINTVEARMNGISDSDASQFYIEKQVTPLQKVPATGPDLALLFLAGQGVLLTVGLKLRKKAVK